MLRDNNRGVIGAEVLVEREESFSRCTDVTSKRLMIMRLENIQVGKGQYLYKTGRHISGTKSMKPMNEFGSVGARAQARRRRTK